MMKKDTKRKSFVFYIEWQEVLMEYPEEVRLEVYDAIIKYAASGTLSEQKPLAKMAFSFIKKQIDENLLHEPPSGENHWNWKCELLMITTDAGIQAAIEIGEIQSWKETTLHVAVVKNVTWS